ncbi:hypothetical protein ACVGVM_15915 [Pseudonocardia bannensis]|uniref:Uncharacterized protein n=1 Tax=Pseudonocardia bannensis TaxID=630973 RepID=A0A848DEI3_9PSEU|nr:hypothetical protein [Pseudonocardia bannensis]NMH90999.1 hypothetical protein [Pseudonocardia bannensis]
MTTTLVVLAALAAIGVLARLQLSHVRRERRERGSLFDDAGHLLDAARVHREGLGYPVLTGTYRGHPVRLEPVVEALALRKLPVLWLLVTQHRELDVGAPLDILTRPSGTEFFSPNAGFAHELERPAGFPSHVRIASPDPAAAPAPGALEFLAPLLHDPRTKDVLLTAGGVRVVRRLAEGAQGPYRTARRADFGPVQIRPDGLRELLDTVSGIGDLLAVGRVEPT